MYLKPFCRIEFAGKYRLRGAIEIEIKKSIHQTVQIAKVKLPLSVVMRNADLLKRIKLTDQVKEGDSIKIWIGVNGKDRLEFEGYIRRINYGTPLEFECEDDLYLMRKVNFAHSFRQVSLVALLTYALDKLKTDKGLQLALYKKVPELIFKNFIMRPGTTGLQIFQELRDKYGLYCYLTEIDGKKTLYCSLAFSLNKGLVKHKLNYNTTKDTELKYNLGDDKLYKVKVTVFQKNGMQQDYEFGDKNGELRTVFLYGDYSHDYIKHFADVEMQKFRSSGYSGNIVTMLIPFSEPGMTSQVIDPQFNDRAGKYYIGTVTTRLGSGGGRRTNELEVRLNAT